MVKQQKDQQKKKGKGKGFILYFLLPVVLAAALVIAILEFSGVSVSKLASGIPVIGNMVKEESASTSGNSADAEKLKQQLKDQQATIDMMKETEDAKNAEIDDLNQQIVKLENQLNGTEPETDTTASQAASAGGETAEEEVATPYKAAASSFSKMDDAKAAAIISKLDNDKALGVLQELSGKKRGTILAEMDAEAAASYTSAMVDDAEKEGQAVE
ncbi:MotE family protein [Terribacillus saccharophilus]|uniref:MotE family protein n=1 Tax=Terribacillus saccharophilus TaxID=361277 RepID=UPI003981FA6D